MYQPPAFKEERVEVMHDLIRAHPFATLICLADGALTANHIPLMLHSDLGEKGTLRGHVARANSIWKDFDAGVDVITVFQGVQHYITPSWYPTKKEHEKVVPTWNYAVVHAHGPMSVFKEADWLRTQVESLTDQQETSRNEPWAVTDAPADFVDRQLRGIVGIEIPIARLEGKWKLSQNRGEEDRHGVIDGLGEEDAPDASRMAKLIPR